MALIPPIEHRIGLDVNSRGRFDPEIWTGPKRAHFDVEASGAMKETTGKPPLDLVPAELVYAAGRAFDFGAKKYSRHNWRKGIPTSKLYSALDRHIKAWNEGEEKADDSGLSHLDHAAACLAMLLQTLKDHPHLDDRYKKVTIGDSPDGRV